MPLRKSSRPDSMAIKGRVNGAPESNEGMSGARQKWERKCDDCPWKGAVYEEETTSKDDREDATGARLNARRRTEAEVSSWSNLSNACQTGTTAIDCKLPNHGPPLLVADPPCWEIACDGGASSSRYL